MVEVKVGVDDNADVVDAVAVGLELVLDRAVNDLVVAVDSFVAAADACLEQDESGWVSQCEREDLT